jgi:hypothetical protein
VFAWKDSNVIRVSLTFNFVCVVGAQQVGGVRSVACRSDVHDPDVIIKVKHHIEQE